MGQLIELRPPQKVNSGLIEINLPGSKSVYNRLLVMRSLSNGQLEISGTSNSEDSLHLKNALDSSEKNIWMGEGGTALRFGLAWAAVTPGERTLDGSERLRQRPIDDLVQALNQLGADIEYLEDQGRLPIRVNGQRLKGGTVQFERNLSSQFISALLMIGPYTDDGVQIKLAEKQVSMPYIEMTVGLMKKAGAQVEMAKDNIHVRRGAYSSTTISVEKDWSSASYFYLWKLFNQNLELLIIDLEKESVQGDSAIVGLFSKFGVSTNFIKEGALLKNCTPELPDSIDFLKIPDMAQSFAVAAVGINLKIHLSGLSTLRIKETDRISALQNEMKKFGVNSNANEDSLDLFTHEGLNEKARLSTYRDHRMAMAFAPLVSKMEVLEIEDPNVVGKSFPDYWQEVAKLGVKITKT